MIKDLYGRGHAFDHAELWGVGGVPLFFVGHPYGVGSEAILTLAAIRQLGMNVEINALSWYGHGTTHVEVAHYDTASKYDTRTSYELEPEEVRGRHEQPSSYAWQPAPAPGDLDPPEHLD
jgi:hypothetical protein